MTDQQNQKLEFYDKLIDTNPNIKKKGKTMPYTSVNGHMFSQLNKDGEIGIRLSTEQCKQFMKKYNTTKFKSYGAVMRGYVLIPEHLFENIELLANCLNDSYEYVKSLESKDTKK